MHFEPVIAIVMPTPSAGFAIVALAFTAVIILPAGFLFGLLWEKVTAKISKKH